MTGRTVVAIDGPSGSGKSTVARGLAAELGLPHVDTGALYRAVTLAVLRSGTDPGDEPACAEIARSARIEQRAGHAHLCGEDVEEEIRGKDVTAAVSMVAAHPSVREAMVPVQRQAAEDGGVVEGRDIGTVVFPDADLKIYLTASREERARRRASQLGRVDQASVENDLYRRDRQDAGRAVAPLTQAEDAWEIDTTTMSAQEAVEAIASLARAVWGGQGGPRASGSSARTASAGESGVERRRTVSGAPQERRERSRLRSPKTATGEAAAREVAWDDDEPVAAGSPRPRSNPIARRRQLPRVVVVGRPNVGKSTLVNRVIGHRAAIVEHRPGVTRDRTEHFAGWRGRSFLVVDTGGWEHAAEGMSGRVVEQAERAIAEADLVVIVVDATVGLLEDDERYARLLRRAAVPVLLVANKVDSPKQLPDLPDLYALGLGEPHPVSAAHGRGMGDLLDAIVGALPAEPGADALDESGVPRVAIVGRPNVGKSSLFNRLVGAERAIVDPVPHTTRDAIEAVAELDDEPWIFVDTAGLRRRYRHGEEIELYSVDRTRRAVEGADLVVFVVDASEPLGEQDQRLGAMVRDAGRGIVLVLNKWDLVVPDRRVDLERELERLLSFAAWAPRLNVSAFTGRGMDRILPRLREVWQAYHVRIPTGELNTWLHDTTSPVPPPPTRGGRPLRIRYATQIRAAPPTFLLFANGPVPATYRRYLERQLRDRYGFVGVPLVFEDRRSGGQRRRKRR
ncbi:MAG: ribosome biogenesis GTPase Der [Actinomycetota bacterium]|nr:ribosome biogenesis GTPase Der [Actinomycetota bacterium]